MTTNLRMRIDRRLDRIEWWWLRRQLWWAYIRQSGPMLNRRVDVEQVLMDVAKGKREALTPRDCYELAMYLGTKDRPWPQLHAKKIGKETRDA